MPAKRELTMRQLRYLLRLHHEGVGRVQTRVTLSWSESISDTRFPYLGADFQGFFGISKRVKIGHDFAHEKTARNHPD